MLLAAVWLGDPVRIAPDRADRRPDAGGRAGARRRSGGARARRDRPTTSWASCAAPFNRMTSQIEQQRGELVDANTRARRRGGASPRRCWPASRPACIERRRQRHGSSCRNRSALELLALPEDGVLGRPLADVVPELAPLVAQAARAARPRHPGPGRDPAARHAPHPAGAHRRRAVATRGGFVVTFDDITELLSAQRKAAWADVARRIAHEIKNPLTPIQLSAERLKRRYLKQIKDDPETFSICTDTIIRQVGDIGRMVDEFSSFARMPRAGDAARGCRASSASRRCSCSAAAHPEIALSRRLCPTDAGAADLRSPPGRPGADQPPARMRPRRSRAGCADAARRCRRARSALALERRRRDGAHRRRGQRQGPAEAKAASG